MVVAGASYAIFWMMHRSAKMAYWAVGIHWVSRTVVVKGASAAAAAFWMRIGFGKVVVKEAEAAACWMKSSFEKVV